MSRRSSLGRTSRLNRKRDKFRTSDCSGWPCNNSCILTLVPFANTILSNTLSCRKMTSAMLVVLPSPCNLLRFQASPSEVLLSLMLPTSAITPHMSSTFHPPEGGIRAANPELDLQVSEIGCATQDLLRCCTTRFACRHTPIRDAQADHRRRLSQGHIGTPCCP